MQDLVREAISHGHPAADPVALAAQVRLFRSAAGRPIGRVLSFGAPHFAWIKRNHDNCAAATISGADIVARRACADIAEYGPSAPTTSSGMSAARFRTRSG